ncbi:glycosyl hydrolase [Burkholderia singularis]|uniref:glycosyl hydrolase n=1 Tax=Burkholderia singularis TaxID=1503053 RepID=UPI000ADA974D|nr:glycosyl hydrolase [Burkholderia singularis]
MNHLNITSVRPDQFIRYPKYIPIVFATLFALLLTACGGGDGSNTNSSLAAATPGIVVPASSTSANSTSNSNTSNPIASATPSAPSAASATDTSSTSSTPNAPPSASASDAASASHGSNSHGSGSSTSSSGSGSSSSSTTTPPASSSSTSPAAWVAPFFGTNGHFVATNSVYSSTPLATQASHLTTAGIHVYRQDAYIPDHIDAIADKLIPGLGPNVTVLPMIEANPWVDPSLNGKQPTEETAYAYAYQLSVYAAQKLAGIPMVEFGNEYDLDSHNAPIRGDGVNVSDFDNSTFPIWRGALRGALDGWRSVDTQHKTKLIANATAGWLYFGFLDGLMTGTQPDGTTGHPKITPDVIQWHWYSDGGDIENAVGLTGTYNVLARLKASYNLPIVITEVGVNLSNTEAQAQAYITKTIAELVAARTTYNVIGFNWYELYDDSTGAYGLMTNSGQPKPRYTTMQTAITNATTTTKN